METTDTTSTTTFSPFALISVLTALSSALACVVTSILTYAISPGLAVIIAFLPIFGIAAVVTGMLALRQISASEGVIAGRPAALVGLFLGLIMTVLQGAFSVGVFATYSALRTDLAPAVDAFVVPLMADDLDAARAGLGPATSGLDDDALRAFAAAINADHGSVSGAAASLDTVLRAAASSREMMSNAQAQTTLTAQPRPVDLVTPAGPTLAWVFLDEASLDAKLVLIDDMLVMSPDGSRGVILRENGPAAEVARLFGATTTQSNTDPTP